MPSHISEKILKELVNPSSSALIDVQNAYFSPTGSLGRLGYDISPVANILDSLERFIKVAREQGLAIFFTRMIEDSKDMAPNSQLISSELSRTNDHISALGSKDFEYSINKPMPEDTEIIKNSYDAFSNPELQHELQKRKIENLIFTGANAEVCVDTTLRSAYTKGYNIVVPTDLVATRKEKLYRKDVAMEIWNEFFAHLVSSEEIENVWGA
jgi:nicotinamidase-related amidase